MTLPLRYLPLEQQWSCHACVRCCREMRVEVSEAERQRIEAHDWSQEGLDTSTPLIVQSGPPWQRRSYLHHQPDGSCVFLSATNRCLIHERLGQAAKPFACRLFPFVLVPVGDHWRVGVRSSCPSAAANRGEPLTEHTAELQRLIVELVEREPQAAQAQAAPPLQGKQRSTWPDLLLFLRAVMDILADRSTPLERRWRKCLALVSLCRQAQFDKLAGHRLSEFLDLVIAQLDDEVPARAQAVPQPGWIGRALFRMLAGILSRKDRGELRGVARHGRFALFRAGLRCALGTGFVPPLNAALEHVSFGELEVVTGGLPPEAQATLERYYLTKLNALQFCGSANFGLAFWDGVEMLAFTMPAICWLARAMPSRPSGDAITEAISIVDDHLGSNPIMAARWLRASLRILARRGELVRLIAWYSR